MMQVFGLIVVKEAVSVSKSLSVFAPLRRRQKTVDDFLRAGMIEIHRDLLTLGGGDAAIAEFLMEDARADLEFRLAGRAHRNCRRPAFDLRRRRGGAARRRARAFPAGIIVIGILVDARRIKAGLAGESRRGGAVKSGLRGDLNLALG